ncbi:MAG TPA: methylisocitrate lyase [Saprospiraceae bacterium]|nr:methylisocitrate lyase [Saprospiraceae bacterium]
MLYDQIVTAATKRKNLHNQLHSGKLLRFPGAPNALMAKMIERIGFEGIYISGGVMANTLGFPDVGLTTLSEICYQAKYIVNATSLPTIIDADTGFGEVLNVARSIQELESLGLCGCHIEDQQNPKRCGHLDNKSVLPVQEVVKKIIAAHKVKFDPNFLIIARTDARASEGIDKAIDRAKAYVDAGANMIFPEAMQEEHDFELMRKALNVPILANMTEFGKSKLLSTSELQNLGINMVIYPVTLQRIAMRAVETALLDIKEKGHQNDQIANMQSRADLYDLIDYEGYNQFDESVFNFVLPSDQ